MVEHVDRDPHDLAGLLGDVGDAVGVLPLAEGQADGDLVHDALCSTFSRSPSGPSQGQRAPVGQVRLVVEEADDPQAELAMRFQLRGEGLAARSGPGDEDEPAVHAPAAQVPEGQPEDGPGDEGDGELGREEDERGRGG